VASIDLYIHTRKQAQGLEAASVGGAARATKSGGRQATTGGGEVATMCGHAVGPDPLQAKEDTMNSTVKVALLVVVIVACLGFVVFRLVGGKPKGGPGAPGVGVERDLYCMECKKGYKASLDESIYMPLLMGGQNVNPKHTCPNCGKAAGVAALKCAACGEIVPSPGMQGMMGGAGGRSKGITCPKCKKPLILQAPTAAPGPAPAQ